jgi:hypothetical protein
MAELIAKLRRRARTKWMQYVDPKTAELLELAADALEEAR